MIVAKTRFTLQKISACCLAIFFIVVCSNNSCAQALKIIIIRHAEKPDRGDNLSCQGLNRARLLPAVIVAKFGVPSFIYVPAVSAGPATKHARMLETIIPLAVKYNLDINSQFDVKNVSGAAADILIKRGVVLVVWEHNNMADLVQALGIKNASFKWEPGDFDSILIITYNKGIPVFSTDKEGLKPGADCN